MRDLTISKYSDYRKAPQKSSQTPQNFFLVPPLHPQIPKKNIAQAKYCATYSPTSDSHCICISVFMDIHVMVFMAFGYLLSFLKRFSYGGVAFTFFGAALAAQWGILMTGIFNELIWGHPHIELSIKS